MSVVVVGVSHRMASVALLERLALDAERLRKLLIDTRTRAHLAEAVVVATCNRIEVYAEADRFHGGIDDITDLLATHTGVGANELTPHLFARYEQGAIAHLFGLACGLDSMVVGETQILGQVKAALRTAQDVGTAGTVLNGLFQRALHVGKRAHSETALGRAGRSLVGAALREVAAGATNQPDTNQPDTNQPDTNLPATNLPDTNEPGADGAVTAMGTDPLSGSRALVIGAGSMAALAATVLRRDHGAEVLIANRTPERAARLARDLEARAVELTAVDELLPTVDLVVSCTGANELVLGYDRVRRALDGSARAAGADDLAGAGDPPADPVARPLAIVDLAMPRDVDDAVAELPGVRLINLDGLSTRLGDSPEDGAVSDREPADLAAVRSIVASEVDGYVRQRQASTAKPTVVALRSMAADVVGAELQRLSGRLSMDETAYAEVEKTVRRVVDKLLHVPTVRVKELGEQPVETSYADALRELFALEPSVAALLENPPEPSNPTGSADPSTAEPAAGATTEPTVDPAAEPPVTGAEADAGPEQPPSERSGGTQPYDGKW